MQHDRSFTRVIQKQVGARYLLFLPEGYGADPAQRWPLILFLHGAGERGSDLSLVKRHGPPRLAEERPADFPFIVVSPQCPEGETWDADVLLALLDEVCATYAVDEERIYLTGLSMGGMGAFDLALTAPHRFAAVAPICGAGNPLRVRPEHAVLPFWVFHGDQDEIVPPAMSAQMVEALRAVGAPVKFTLYPGVAHDSWTQTYANPELYQWFLQHRRHGAATA
ncbi:carboxylesterase family protein [Symbiobacterium terraclitae]|uniref:carboxylesterase family protein n=1 Tax=Symbiobacterium terraclitae TaxID=557451 RepID=UPI0035B5315A